MLGRSCGAGVDVSAGDGFLVLLGAVDRDGPRVHQAVENLPVVEATRAVAAEGDALIGQGLLAVGTHEVVGPRVAALLGHETVGEGVGLVAVVPGAAFDDPLVVDVADRHGVLVDAEGVRDELFIVVGADPGHSEPGADPVLDAGGDGLAQGGHVRAVSVIGCCGGVRLGELYAHVAGQVAAARDPRSGVFSGAERQRLGLELLLDGASVDVHELSDPRDVDAGAFVHAHRQRILDCLCGDDGGCRLEDVGGEHGRFAADHPFLVEVLEG